MEYAEDNLKQEQIQQPQQILKREIASADKLPQQFCSWAENTIGYDLGEIRVKYYAEAPEALGAQAVAIGNVILQESADIQDTLHELKHIIQNAQGRVHQTDTVEQFPFCEDSQLEREAVDFEKVTYISAQKHSAQPAFDDADEEITSHKPDTVRLPVLKAQNNIMQFELLIRTTPTIINKQYHRDTKRGEPKKAAPFQNFCRITEEFIPMIIESFHINPEYQETAEQILLKLVGKTTDDGAPISYIFNSTEELFDYIDIVLQKRSERPLYKINVINVGQGDAILVTLPDQYYLIDLSDDVQKVIEFLEYKKDTLEKGPKKRLPIQDDKIITIITHNHRDHRGGDSEDQKKVCENLKIIAKGMSDLKSKEEEKLSKLLDDFAIIEYNKQDNNPNNDSIVLVKIIGKDLIILAGDVDSKLILDELEGYKTDRRTFNKAILKVPHHGSYANMQKDATGRTLFSVLKELCNRVILMVSSGDNRTYNHPSNTTLHDENDTVWEQGTEIRYDMEDGRGDGSILPMNAYYTKNIGDAVLNQGKIGSIVYKATENKSVQYTKIINKAAKTNKITETEAQARNAYFMRNPNADIMDLTAQTSTAIVEINKIENDEKRNKFIAKILGELPDESTYFSYVFALLEESNQKKFLQFLYDEGAIDEGILRKMGFKDEKGLPWIQKLPLEGIYKTFCCYSDEEEQQKILEILSIDIFTQLAEKTVKRRHAADLYEVILQGGEPEADMKTKLAVLLLMCGEKFIYDNNNRILMLHDSTRGVNFGISYDDLEDSQRVDLSQGIADPECFKLLFASLKCIRGVILDNVEARNTLLPIMWNMSDELIQAVFTTIDIKAYLRNMGEQGHEDQAAQILDILTNAGIKFEKDFLIMMIPILVSYWGSDDYLLDVLERGVSNPDEVDFTKHIDALYR